ncbi:MAG: hypothetical protein NZ750_12165 [Anaerolineae bacterium]|nr:hypothetical protein [Anaerolineae bacterium]MDW8173882.1 hypothetical protein [Anaerolineae bacterium]
MPDLSIRPVTGPAEMKAFFRFPWQHYQGDPYWTPPLLSMRREILDKRRHPAWDYMDGEYFLAWRGAQVVGTVGVVINHRHNEHWRENVAWFGMFECQDDVEAARGLLHAAADWARARGCVALRGPQNFTTHEEVGVQVAGFGLPMILMSYNYPYYDALVQAAGLHKVMDVISFYYTRESLINAGTPELLKKIYERVTRRGVVIRAVDMRRKQEEFRKFRDIYNAAWEANWGFVPMTDRELDALIKSLGQFFDPSMAFFAEIDGQMVGFALTIPNFNEVLHHVYPRPGTPELWTLLRAGIEWKLRKRIHSVRLPLMGVVAEHRNKGIDAALISRMFESLVTQTQYEYMDAGWVLETNPLCQILLKYGGNPYRTHRFYEMAL